MNSQASAAAKVNKPIGKAEREERRVQVQRRPIAEGVPGFQATKNKDGRWEKKNTYIVEHMSYISHI